MDQAGLGRINTTVALAVAVASLCILLTSVLVDQSHGTPRRAFVVLNSIALLCAPAAAAGISRQAVRSRILAAVVTMAVDIAVVNVVWTGGYDNDTVHSHLQASLLALVVAGLLAIVVIAARAGDARPAPSASPGHG